MVAVPAAWTIRSEFVKRFMSWATSERFRVAPFFELSATRLDFSLSKIIAVAKRFNPDVLLRFDSDVVAGQPFDQVIDLIRSDFRSGFDYVYSPTRSATGYVMSLPHDPVECSECKAGKHLPELNACTPSFFGALGYSALSPKLIEAYRPHMVEYGPSPYEGECRQVRYVCRNWSNYIEPPLPSGWERKVELAEVDPELNAHVPMYVVNPPDNSEDADICFDIRSNGFRLGCDTRLRGQHLKGAGVANYGSDARDYARPEPAT